MTAASSKLVQMKPCRACPCAQGCLVTQQEWISKLHKTPSCCALPCCIACVVVVLDAVPVAQRTRGTISFSLDRKSTQLIETVRRGSKILKETFNILNHLHLHPIPWLCMPSVMHTGCLSVWFWLSHFVSFASVAPETLP